MKITKSKISNIKNVFGKRGEEYIDILPKLYERIINDWKLSSIKEIEEDTINFVYFAKSETHGDVVLKLGVPHTDSRTEAIALKYFDKKLACNIYEYEEKYMSKVIERITPGYHIKGFDNTKDMLDVALKVIPNIPIKVETHLDIPNYTKWINDAFDYAKKNKSMPTKLFKLIDFAQDVFDKLDYDKEDMYLLHGDLHHMNILKCDRYDWRIIDPKGIIAPRYFEAARFLNNHHCFVDNLDEVIDAIDKFSIAFEVDKIKIISALIILDMLTICWLYEGEEVNIDGIKEQVENLKEIIEIYKEGLV